MATHAITAVYSGDGDFTTSTSAAVNQGVNQARTKTTLALFRQSLDLGAVGHLHGDDRRGGAGSGTPTGNVTFDDGTTELGTATLSGGTASFTTATLSVGTHSITAVYSGDGNFTASNSAILKQVIQASSGSSVAASAGPVVNPVLGALVDEAPTSGSLVYDLTLEQVAAPGRRSRRGIGD